MNELFKNFLKPKNVLGCDIGTASLKVVYIKDDNGLAKLESFGLIDTDPLSEHTICIQRAKAFLKEHGLSGHNVSLNVEDKSLRIRRMDLPEMPKGDMKIAIRWNFREYVDGPIEKFSVDYSGYGDMKVNGDKRPVLAFAVANDAVEKLIKVTKLIGLKPVFVEPNATALLSAFDHSVGWEKDKFSVIIDMGGTLANFVVLGNGLLLFSRPIANTGVNWLIKSISKEMLINDEAAIDLIKAYISKPGEQVEQKFSTAVSQFLSQMVIEVQRSIDAFCLQFHTDKVGAIYLAGGGSMIPGICEHISKNLGVSAKIFDPFEKIDISIVGGKIPNPQLYAVAVGLALPRE